MSTLLSQLITDRAAATPEATALLHKQQSLSYRQLNNAVNHFANLLEQLNIRAGDRVAVYLPKQFETVIALFGALHFGAVMVPINPQLRASQVEHILNDSEASILVTSQQRWQGLHRPQPSELKHLTNVVLIDRLSENLRSAVLPSTIKMVEWALNVEESRLSTPSNDHLALAALLYTSGSTGKAKGVMLSHQNMVEGAKSVAQYLENTSSDRLLALLPLSFDYGFSQLTTAFLSGASVVLLDYLLPRDVIKAINHYQVTGVAAVPPVWIQLSELDWPESLPSLRYWTNSGGAMPTTTLQRLQQVMPNAAPYLMYGLTEAFRSTYLPPERVIDKPTSMGKAIPNAEILVLNEHGNPVAAGEQGELVHRGVHVAQGYWQAPEKTAERFKPLPHWVTGGISEIAVYSGDQVTVDDEGFLYFVSRNDEMIKSSGHRISPQEIEEVIYQIPDIAESAVLGVPHPVLGQGILLLYCPKEGKELAQNDIQTHCRQQLPNYMQPHASIKQTTLPKNANGKIDRAHLRQVYNDYFTA
ncbi:acyl-CoA ligase (AMP-forming), exosortase A system-associated [Pleionea litopenaei]|uniref:Acyl-CoA ligase (AMP-forming), exosortase A system-associated n=1 Tax=Pleionea litopenaei TaxID=3070815 RepID=A0AA51X5R1_9GAMM|nr:acyl-CoA ligase (AMP-forming), exosortase A system-associated [Pleionea sp. HL-JVS1]WMS86422.1 acyl-CoA ligase (AMP-forming), exosortase A system-associated [Pleionea sp. HL-JVS1]